ncbi:MAG: thioredoxin domain-containing protein [Simkania sp.]|nr:thioredoxin domain-containing protein [Chlamydiia bacterium]MCB1082896.1 thioredoxin domain-containing protein [Simkania sp.]MCB9222167.1 thioredoxin domain-containing protein [Ignavibacteria bacterium]
MLSLKTRKMQLFLIAVVWMAPLVLFASCALENQHDKRIEESKSTFSPNSHTKLGEQYCITYGNPRAKIQLVEYFSLSCPLCLKLLKQDFPKLKEKYICSGDVFWVLHPDPADILTLQMMACLVKLSDREKQVFFEGILSLLSKKSSKKIVYWMQTILAEWGRAIPELQELSFLEKTETFQDAYKYVQQTNAPKEVPTIEINGEVQEAFPSYTFIDQMLSKCLEYKNFRSKQETIQKKTLRDENSQPYFTLPAQVNSFRMIDSNNF